MTSIMLEKKIYNSISIIIPAYNEAKTIKEVIERIKKIKFKNLKKQIIVVNDCSTDGTADIIKKISGINFITHEKNQGKGGAIKTGIAASTGDIVAINDADLEYFPEDLEKLIIPITENKARVVYGSRFLNNLKYFSVFYLGNKFLSLTTTILYGQKI